MLHLLLWAVKANLALSSENPVAKVITPARKLLLSEVRVHGCERE